MPGIHDHPKLADVLYYGNPVAPFVDRRFATRSSSASCPQLGDVVYVFGVALAALAVAAFVFRRIDDQLAAQL